MSQISTKQRRRPYPIIKPAEDMPDMPEYRAQARAADIAGQVAFGLGLQFKRQQEEDKIEADKVSALNSQVALDKYDYDELKRIPTIEFGQIEDFDNAYNEYNKGRQSYTNTLLSGKNEDVKQSIKDHALKTEISSQSQYYNQLDRYKTRFAQTQFFDNQRKLAQVVTLDNIKQTKAAMLANINANKDFFTPAQVSSFKAALEKDINTAIADYQQQEISNEALRISQSKGREKAIDWVMKQKIDLDAKRGIVSDINFEAAQRQLEYDKYVEKIEQEFLGKLRQGQLTEDEIMTSTLEVDKKQEWLADIDAQVKERLDGEKELNWDTYDKLQAMVEDYDKDAVSKDEVRKEISKAVKSRDITTTIAMRLRDRLATKDNPDDPMNRSDVKRGLGVLTDLESFEVGQAKKDDKVGLEDIREIRLSYQKKMDEYEHWIRGQEKLTDKDIQNKISEMTELEVDEQVKDWLDYILNPLRWESGTVGTKIRGLLRNKLKESEEVDFQKWYAGHAKRLGLNLNPDDPQHFYDYRAAYLAGVEPPKKKGDHWPSKFKLPGHPRTIVGGINTITGKTEEDLSKLTDEELEAIIRGK